MNISFRKHTLRFKQPAGTSRGVYRTRTIWYVTARDDDDNWGIGECAPLPDLSCDAMTDEDYETVLAEACQMTAEAEGEIPYAALRPFPSILFGLETAILSLNACRTHGNPYCLYDNAFSRGETGTPINGLVWMGSYDEMMERMEEKLSLGFRCIKIKIGAIDWEREISLIRALRGRFPKEVVQIRVDANGGFSPELAMSRLQELARYDIHSIEQPIRQHQWDEMARLCRETPIPIALDEELIGVNDLTEKACLLNEIRPQYIILKPSLHGGLVGCEEWIRLAEERGIGHWITSALESNVGLNAIAQWNEETKKMCAVPQKDFPQGLGTGQLFVENFDAIHLEICGERLWFGNEKEREFNREYREFVAEWQDITPTVSVHTSGSTGVPKPLFVEKTRMRSSAQMTLDFLRIPEEATSLLCMPLRYIAGKMMVVRAIEGHLRLLRQAPSTHPLKGFAVTHSLGIVSIPYFLAVTPMQAMETLKVPEEREIFLRIPRIIIGGGAISHELHEALQDSQGEIYSTYGMTETLSHIAMRRLNGPEQSKYYTLLPGVSISKTPEGCLVIDAPKLSPTSLITHDLCEIVQGRFRILGRTDNIISSGGIKLSLETLESRLSFLEMPFQLTYVNDPLLGQALTLIYMASSEEQSETESLIRRRITEVLSPYERPRHIFCVDTLPTTETGKTARVDAHFLAEKIKMGCIEGYSEI